MTMMDWGTMMMGRRSSIDAVQPAVQSCWLVGVIGAYLYYTIQASITYQPTQHN